MISLSIVLHFPIVGVTLAGSLTILERMIKPLPPWLILAFDFSCCIATPGLLFLCGASTYLCLPTNWTRTCTLIYFSPNIFIAPSDQPLPIPFIHKQRTWAIHLIPLLVGLGIVPEIGTGTARLATSIQNYQALSKDLSDSLQEVSQVLITIQNQLDSVAAIVLQNRRGWDLLTVEKGGFCLFLAESCCFYANQLAHFSESSHNNKCGCYKFTCTQAQPFPASSPSPLAWPRSTSPPLCGVILTVDSDLLRRPDEDSHSSVVSWIKEWV